MMIRIERTRSPLVENYNSPMPHQFKQPVKKRKGMDENDLKDAIEILSDGTIVAEHQRPAQRFNSKLSPTPKGVIREQYRQEEK